MSSTIDNINTCILNKLNYLLTATKILLDYTLEDIDYNKVIDIQNKLEELQTNYELGSLNIVNDYNTLTDQQYKITTTIVPKKMQRITIDEPINDNDDDNNDDNDDDNNDEADESEEEPEFETVEYKNVKYILEDNIMYNIKEDENCDNSKGSKFGTWNDGKVKKYIVKKVKATDNTIDA